MPDSPAAPNVASSQGSPTTPPIASATSPSASGVVSGVTNYFALKHKSNKSYEETITKKNTAKIQDALDKLRRFTRDFDCTQLRDIRIHQQVQEEVAKLVILLQKIENLLFRHCPNRPAYREIASLIDDVELALDILRPTTLSAPTTEDLVKSHLASARNLRIAIERTVNRYQHPHFWSWIVINRFNDTYRSQSTPLKVLYGLIVALIINLTLATGITGALFCLEIISGSAEQARSIKLQEIEEKRIQDQLAQLDRKNNTESALPSMEGELRQDLIGELRQDLIQVQTQLGFDRSQQSKITRNSKFILQIIFVILAGTLGSIVSILIRIEDFQNKKYQDPATPFLIGGFKPIIGASFSIFFFTLISSELVQIPGINTRFVIPSDSLSPEEIAVLSKIPVSNEGKEACFIFALAFLVGFSERLATDAISKMEDAIGGNSQETNKNSSSQEVAVRQSVSRIEKNPSGTTQVTETQDLVVQDNASAMAVSSVVENASRQPQETA
jgi:hypothetical protein